MKQARVMFWIILFCTVATGIVAFRVKNGIHIIYTGKLKSGSCTVEVICAGIGNETPNVAASTIAITEGCPDTFTFSVPD